MLKHLTDEEIQVYVVEKENCDINTVEHVHSCDLCKAKVETYHLLITGIKQQPQPYFDFDLSELVLQKLPLHTKEISNERSLSWVFISIGILVILGTSYFFRDYFSALFKSFGTTILIYLAVVTAITVLGWLFLDLYKKYNKEMKLLDAY